jgi:hypothetical protein
MTRVTCSSDDVTSKFNTTWGYLAVAQKVPCKLSLCDSPGMGGKRWSALILFVSRFGLE